MGNMYMYLETNHAFWEIDSVQVSNIWNFFFSLPSFRNHIENKCKVWILREWQLVGYIRSAQKK